MSQFNSQEQHDETKENMDQLIEEGTTEFQEYMSKLKADANQSNSKSLCCFCWCRLTNYQKQRHTPIHEKGIRSPAKYSDADYFKALAKEFAHVQVIDGKIFYPKIKEGPTFSAQTKKLKLNDETLIKKEQSISINLPPRTNIDELTNFPPCTTSTNQKDILTQERKQTQVTLQNLLSNFLG